MVRRRVIKINSDKCIGCGECIPDCPEGALQLIDGKVRLVNDLFCDGLGACIGSCPYDAITIEVREAKEYDERKVMEVPCCRGFLKLVKDAIKLAKRYISFKCIVVGINGGIISEKAIE